MAKVKQWSFGLAVTNPWTGDRGLVVGFKNRKQAIHIGKLRVLKGTVKNPRIVDYNTKDYYKYLAGHFIVTQKELREEVNNYFEL